VVPETALYARQSAPSLRISCSPADLGFGAIDTALRLPVPHGHSSVFI
jgi:hypothetical protein